MRMLVPSRCSCALEKKGMCAYLIAFNSASRSASTVCVRARVSERASAGAFVDVCSAIPAILCACVRLSIGGNGEKRLTRRYRETSAQRCYLCPTLLCTPCSLRAVQGCDSCCPAEATPPPPTILLCAKAAWRFAQCNSPAAIQTQDAFTLRSHDIIAWAHAIWRTLHEDRSAEQVPAEQLAEAVQPLPCPDYLMPHHPNSLPS